jgi:hypothetical protein
MAALSSIVMAAAAVAGAYVSYKNGQDQKEAVQNAQKQAEANARKQEKAADQATNRANQKKPDTGAILDAATQAGRGGTSGTMLTGAQGVDPATLTLGRNTLLGK